ncbi:hypothetical protein BKA93DRAFT_747824 [Sparassis latifolia]
MSRHLEWLGMSEVYLIRRLPEGTCSININIARAFAQPLCLLSIEFDCCRRSSSPDRLGAHSRRGERSGMDLVFLFIPTSLLRTIRYILSSTSREQVLRKVGLQYAASLMRTTRHGRLDSSDAKFGRWWRRKLHRPRHWQCSMPTGQVKPTRHKCREWREHKAGVWRDSADSNELTRPTELSQRDEWRRDYGRSFCFDQQYERRSEAIDQEIGITNSLTSVPIRREECKTRMDSSQDNGFVQGQGRLEAYARHRRSTFTSGDYTVLKAEVAVARNMHLKERDCLTNDAWEKSSNVIDSHHGPRKNLTTFDSHFFYRDQPLSNVSGRDWPWESMLRAIAAPLESFTLSYSTLGLTYVSTILRDHTWMPGLLDITVYHWVDTDYFYGVEQADVKADRAVLEDG